MGSRSFETGSHAYGLKPTLSLSKPTSPGCLAVDAVASPAPREHSPTPRTDLSSPVCPKNVTTPALMACTGNRRQPPRARGWKGEFVPPQTPSPPRMFPLLLIWSSFGAAPDVNTKVSNGGPFRFWAHTHPDAAWRDKETKETKARERAVEAHVPGLC